ncbi:MAG: PSD1 and planctomycete cytochrome C domain-containing protein, partial [Bryobacterales bacterium]|nr:PSD1 and planctomycete cytochrome C domain-containing protein [Bryobacterales bacterium]
GKNKQVKQAKNNCAPWLTTLLVLLVPMAGLAQQRALPPAADVKVDFAKDIGPLLENRCLGCHSAQLQSSGLRLDSREALLTGGYTGPAIRPGDSAGSKLIHLVAGLEKGIVMPLDGDRLTADQIGLLRAWIDQGAEWPAAPSSGPEAAAARPASRPRATHWAFQPISRPRPPNVSSPGRVRNPIDRFILARLAREGIEPSPEAGKRTLVRRLGLDLLGLPPESEDVARFIADESPEAYERLVDRLLESPHYGEKWAMHWLDLARYADSDGYEKDYVRPHAWRYRHWVINALNADMSFRRFTIDQIAGDLLPHATVEQKVATGFHRNTLKNREGGVKIEQFRFEETVDRVNSVGTVWLGLTLGCAQCHDHKYDPLTQQEYYNFFAFFNNLDEVDIDAPLAGEMGPYLAALPGYRAQREALLAEAGVAELQTAWEEKMKLARANPGKWTDWDHAHDALQKYLDGSDRIIDKHPSDRTRKEIDDLADHFVKNYRRVVTKERYEELGFEELGKKLIALKEDFPAVSEAQTVVESDLHRKSHIHIRGDWQNTGRGVAADLPSFLPAAYTDRSSEAGLTRLDLARWIVSRDNPLTARVIVNRVWQEYFGAGLVATSENFGTQGEKPSHPELLDWLARDFMDHGWSLKHLHKRIVMSATYRQSSKARPELDAVDAGNRWLARQPRLRLPGELVRDSALAVSGLLYPEIGGESMRPPLPEGLAELAYGSSLKWNESEGRDRYRRGLYILFQRSVPYPQLMNFDASERTVTECSRERSNTPLQSLNLLNDPVFVEAAQALAVRLLTQGGASIGDRLRYAFDLALARPPKPAEIEAMNEYYRKQTAILEDDPESARQMFPLDLPGVTPLEGAAWVGVGSVLLNLDEFITRE